MTAMSPDIDYFHYLKKFFLHPDEQTKEMHLNDQFEAEKV